MIIMNCQFLFNDNEMLIISSSSNVHFFNCKFLHNASPVLVKAKYGDINIVNCTFHDNSQILIGKQTSVAIEDTYILNVTFCLYCIELRNSHLMLTGVVIFDNIDCNDNSTIYLEKGSTITLHGLVRFLNNHVAALIYFNINNKYQYLIIEENSVIEFSQNEVQCSLFGSETFEPIAYPYCFFQYFSNRNLEEDINKGNYSIIMYNVYKTDEEDCNNCGIPISKCQWLSESAFHITPPVDVNNQYIRYINHTSILSLDTEQSTLCICSNETHRDCHISELGYLYPGQTLETFLHYHTCVNSVIEIC